MKRILQSLSKKYNLETKQITIYFGNVQSVTQKVLEHEDEMRNFS